MAADSFGAHRDEDGASLHGEDAGLFPCGDGVRRAEADRGARRLILEEDRDQVAGRVHREEDIAHRARGLRRSRGEYAQCVAGGLVLDSCGHVNVLLHRRGKIAQGRRRLVRFSKHVPGDQENPRASPRVQASDDALETSRTALEHGETCFEGFPEGSRGLSADAGTVLGQERPKFAMFQGVEVRPGRFQSAS